MRSHAIALWRLRIAVRPAYVSPPCVWLSTEGLAMFVN